VRNSDIIATIRIAVVSTAWCDWLARSIAIVSIAIASIAMQVKPSRK